MKIIYKYQLKITDNQLLRMPLSSKILTVQDQDGKLTLWVIVETDNAECYRSIQILGTGNPFTENCGLPNFIDTVQIAGFVWHIFDMGEL